MPLGTAATPAKAAPEKVKAAKSAGIDKTSNEKAPNKKAPQANAAQAEAKAGPKSEPKSSPKPATVKTLTTALKPKSSAKPETPQAAKPTLKPAPSPAAEADVPAAKIDAKTATSKVTPSVTVQAPQAPDKQAAKPAAKQTAPQPEPGPAPEAAQAHPAAAAPAPAAARPAPPQAAAPQPAAPQSHSGVISGPMRPLTPPRAMAKAEIFVDGDFVVYPTHGVGKVERIAVEEIAGHKLELIHITFDENRMTLRVPTNKARTAGLRKLASRKQFDDVLATLKGRARIKRTMWSRRAQEYEAKINSGDPSAIAEVVRDLHRNSGQPDQSFSERQIYESALDRLAAEYAALEKTDKATAAERLIAHLKSE